MKYWFCSIIAVAESRGLGDKQRLSKSYDKSKHNKTIDPGGVLLLRHAVGHCEGGNPSVMNGRGEQKRLNHTNRARTTINNYDVRRFGVFLAIANNGFCESNPLFKAYFRRA
jgi:hypothetical protein